MWTAFTTVAIVAAAWLALAVDPRSMKTSGTGLKWNLFCETNDTVEDIVARVDSLPDNLKELTFSDCDLMRMNFSCLERLVDLETLGVYDGSMVEFAAMPLMPTLDFVYVFTSGFRRWYGAGLTPKLDYVFLYNISDDGVMDDILGGLAAYEDTLVTLHLHESGLTRIPPKATQLKRLDYFDSYLNPLTTVLKAGSFPAAFTPQTIKVEYCNITSVEVGAFQGDYGGRGVYLTGSQLPSLDEGVFGPMLRSMHNASEGLLYLDKVGNCDCSLAWLNRDNAHLLAYITNAQCYVAPFGWTAVEQLDPSFFTSCPPSNPKQDNGIKSEH